MMNDFILIYFFFIMDFGEIFLKKNKEIHLLIFIPIQFLFFKPMNIYNQYICSAHDNIKGEGHFGEEEVLKTSECVYQ